MTIAAGGRHALPRRGARLSPARRMMTAALAAGAATALAVVASGGTYALLNSGATTAGGTLRAGTATLSVTSPLTVDATRLNPGSIVLGTAVVQNTGNVPLALRISALTLTSTSNAFTTALTVGVSAVASDGTCPATPAASTWNKTFAQAAATSPAVVPADLGLQLAKETGTAKVCVAVQLPSTASAATNINPATPVAFTLQLDGRQVS